MAGEPAAGPEALTGLLARWGIPAGADLARTVRGSNNRTFAVRHGGRRWVLRISQNLSADQARAEHRLLARLGRAGLPFGVPEPVPTLAGESVAETHAGPATLCRWIPGIRPDLSGEPALERFGRAIGQLSRAMRAVPRSDAPQDWRGDPLRAHPDAPDVGELCQALRDVGVPAARVARLETASRHVLPWAPDAAGDPPPAQAGPGDPPPRPGPGELPGQVVHGDVGPSNVLVDERTGEVTGVLDFELAGPGWRVQDLISGLLLSRALDEPDWPRRAAALARGHASALRLGRAEIEAVPGLLMSRCAGSVLWRAGRWRRGQAGLADVADRVAELDATATWLAAHGEQLLSALVSG